MANDINEWVLSGTVTTVPELKVIEKGGKTYQTTTFPIAVHSYANGKETSMFVSIECWGSNAEYASRYFFKGSRICVHGEYAETVYEKNGSKHRYSKLRADQFFAPKQVNTAEAAETAGAIPTYDDGKAYDSESGGAPDFEPQRKSSARYNMDQIDTDDTLPF